MSRRGIICWPRRNDEALMKMWLSGQYSLGDMAERFGFHRETVSKHAKRLGLPMRHAGRPIAPPPPAEAVTPLDEPQEVQANREFEAAFAKAAKRNGWRVWEFSR